MTKMHAHRMSADELMRDLTLGDLPPKQALQATAATFWVVLAIILFLAVGPE